MNDKKKPDSGHAAQETQALEAVRRMRPPVLPEEVRQRAARAFLTGESNPAGAAPISSQAPKAASGSGFAWIPRIALPIAAVLALAGTYVLGSRPADHWTVTDVVALHGVSLARGCDNPGETIYAGRLAVSDSSEFEVQLGRELKLRLLGGTTLNLPAGPGHLFGKTRTLQLLGGEVYGTTAGSPLGFTLRLTTPEAVGVLTGTTFAVIRTEDATCFCLYEGSLDITPLTGAPPVELPVGKRVFLYRDGRPAVVEPLPPRETMKLTMIHDSGIVTPPTHEAP